MFYVILFVVSIIVAHIIELKFNNKHKENERINFYAIIPFLTIPIALIVATPLNYGLSNIAETKAVLIKSEDIISQKYKQKEGHYSVYKATGGKNDNEERYYYSTSTDGVLTLDYKPVGYSYIRHSDSERVETYVDRFVNPNIKFWLFTDKVVGEKHIFYVKDDNIDLK